MKSKTIRNLALLLVTIILAFSMIACRTDDIDDRQDEVVEYENIVITDHLGREVVFEEPAERIVSGYYISTSMMIPLDLKDQIVGIENKPETRPIYGLAAPEFLGLPNVGTMKEFDIEGTAALDPDLVILSIRLQDAIETLEELGINVIGINPESMEELNESLIMIGKATDREEEAEEKKTFSTCITVLRTEYSGLPVAKVRSRSTEYGLPITLSTLRTTTPNSTVAAAARTRCRPIRWDGGCDGGQLRTACRATPTRLQRLFAERADPDLKVASHGTDEHLNASRDC